MHVEASLRLPPDLGCPRRGQLPRRDPGAPPRPGQDEEPHHQEVEAPDRHANPRQLPGFPPQRRLLSCRIRRLRRVNAVVGPNDHDCCWNSSWSFSGSGERSLFSTGHRSGWMSRISDGLVQGFLRLRSSGQTVTLCLWAGSRRGAARSGFIPPLIFSFSFDSLFYLILCLLPSLLSFVFIVFSSNRTPTLLPPPSGQHLRPQPLQCITTHAVNFDLSQDGETCPSNSDLSNVSLHV